MSVESLIPSNHLIICHPPLLLPSVFPSIRVFSNELALHIRWPKYWSFSINNSSEYSGLRIYVKMAPEAYSARLIFLCSHVISASGQVMRKVECALKKCARTFLTVQWLRLHVPSAGGYGFNPWLGNYGPECCKSWQDSEWMNEEACIPQKPFPHSCARGEEYRAQATCGGEAPCRLDSSRLWSHLATSPSSWQPRGQTDGSWGRRFPLSL